MSLHRCAACGSQNVVVDTQSGGVTYNYKKGIVGTAVFGIGGAVAGVESKSQEVFKCQDCGMILTYEMPADLRKYIDIALIDEKAREDPSLYTDLDPLICSWRFLKENYKNIEEGSVDKFNAGCDNVRNMGLMSYATATQEEFNNAVDMIVKYFQDVSSPHYVDKMTLVEYYSLQNAVNILVENIIKFIPNLYLGRKRIENDCHYRGLERYHISNCVALYIFEHCKAQTGEYPKVGSRYCSENLKKYAENDFFILDFLNKFYEYKILIFGTYNDTIIPWTAEKFEKVFCSDGIGGLYKCFFRSVYFKFEDCNGKEINCGYYIPKYIIDNGGLYSWKERDEEQMKMEYFSKNPEKKSEYNKKINEHKKQVSEKGNIEQEIKTLEQDISHNKNIIGENSTTITKLRNKIFGKKSALEKANELEKENQTLTKKNSELSVNLNKLNTQIQNIVDDETFYRNLVEEMDCFVVWHYVNDAE